MATQEPDSLATPSAPDPASSATAAARSSSRARVQVVRPGMEPPTFSAVSQGDPDQRAVEARQLAANEGIPLLRAMARLTKRDQRAQLGSRSDARVRDGNTVQHTVQRTAEGETREADRVARLELLDHVTTEQMSRNENGLVEFVHTNRSFEVMAAVLNAYARSGMFTSEFVDTKDDDGIARAAATISRSVASAQVKTEAMRNFCDVVGADARFCTCLACGRRDFLSGTAFENMTRHKVSGLSALKFSASETERINAIGAEHRCAFNYTTIDNTYFHVYEAALDDDATGYLCEICLATLHRDVAPPFSLAAGFDPGGLPPGLPELSMLESMAIQRGRLFQRVVKIRSNGGIAAQASLNGHSIVFRVAAPELMTDFIAKTLPRRDLDEFVQIFFVGKLEKWNESKNSFVGGKSDFVVRPEVVFLWINFLVAVNVLFSDIVIDRTEDSINYLRTIGQSILDAAHVSESDMVNTVDEAAASNAAGFGQDSEAGVGMPSVFATSAIATALPVAGLNETDDRPEFAVVSMLDKPAGRQPAGDDNGDHEDEDARGGDDDRDTGTRKPDHVHDVLRVEVGAETISEFGSFNTLLLAVFPHLFPVGRLPMSDLTPGLAKWLLNHYLPRVRNDIDLTFLLFDALRRHAVVRSVFAMAQSDAASLKYLREFVSDASSLEQLRKAAQYPEAPASQRLLSIIRRHTVLTGKKPPGSLDERRALLSQIKAFCFEFGTPTYFLTFTPDDISSNLLIRFVSAGDEAEFTVDLSAFAVRARLLAQNPTAQAQAFRVLVEALVDKLICLVDERRARGDHGPVSSRSTGVFGLPIAFFGVTESQGRGSPHIHLVGWSETGPALVSKLSHLDQCSALIADVIDSILTAQLPGEYHLPNDDRDATWEARLRLAVIPGRSQCPDLLTETGSELFHRLFCETACVSQKHTHKKTCRKGTLGKTGCRLCMPRGIHDGPTGVVMLEATMSENGRAAVKVDAVAVEDPPTGLTLFDDADQRLLYWEAKRPAQLEWATDPPPPGSEKLRVNENGYLTEFNDVLSCLVTGNNNVQFTGSDQQARPILMYLMKYLTKDGNETSNSLSILLEALRLTTKYGSVADDNGTVGRNAQLFLTKVNNMRGSKVDIPAATAALVCLGDPLSTRSHSTVHAYVWPARHALVALYTGDDESVPTTGAFLTMRDTMLAALAMAPPPKDTEEMDFDEQPDVPQDARGAVAQDAAQDAARDAHGAVAQAARAQDAHGAVAQDAARDAHGAVAQDAARDAHGAVAQDAGAQDAHGAVAQDAARDAHGAVAQDARAQDAHGAVGGARRRARRAWCSRAGRRRARRAWCSRARRRARQHRRRRCGRQCGQRRA